MKPRVQHPKIHERRDRSERYWFFRYYHDQLLPNGQIKTTRKLRIVGPSRGDNALTKKQAEVERDRFLVTVNAAATPCEAAVAAQQPVEASAILFGKLAELWRQDYVDNPKVKLATPTREKYRSRLSNHILPRWKDTRLGEFRTKDILDWLQNECTSWYMMTDIRNIMSGIFTRAHEWELIPETFANPMARVKVGKKWIVRKPRLLDDAETAALFARLDDPHLLICEVCLDTGARISEVVGLQLKHFDPNKGTIRIDQRHCRGDVDEPKTESSKRTLALGTLTTRFESWIRTKNIKRPDDWIFFQDHDRTKPMWDSGVRKALKTAAAEVGCDFEGFGLHSFRRANITLRQEEGGSAIETSKIAGHSNVNMTGSYTIVRLDRQDELTRAVQQRRAKAKQNAQEKLPDKSSFEAA